MFIEKPGAITKFLVKKHFAKNHRDANVFLMVFSMCNVILMTLINISYVF